MLKGKRDPLQDMAMPVVNVEVSYRQDRLAGVVGSSDGFPPDRCFAPRDRLVWPTVSPL
jgi:hypothetical protein